MSTTHPTEDQRRQAEWALLNAQIEHFRKQAKYEPWKALAAIVGAAALMTAAVIALSNWHGAQSVNVQFGQPLQVELKQ